jgi:ABC-type nickel/cobalt efflux system permease component RcnA
MTAFWFSCVLLGMGIHPVPRENHDRRILLRTTPDRIQVLYRHEVDETRALYDLTEHDVDLSKINDRNDIHKAYVEFLAKRIPKNLILKGPKGEIPWTASRTSFEVLDHLRVDLFFEAPMAGLAQGEKLTLEEGNYASDPISLVLMGPWGGPNLPVGKRFLEVEARWGNIGEEEAKRTPAAMELSPKGTSVEGQGAHEDGVIVLKDGLIDLILGQKHGLPILLLLSFVFGAGHALTPGHGKTMVAAYLIGERGTVYQAVLLGLVTTLTHTAAVLIIAGLLPIVVPEAQAVDVQRLLNLVGGLILTGMGGWLLLLRLTGMADHYHGPGGHTHGPGGHTHGPGGHSHGHEPVSPSGARASSWGVVLLGITGGLVPCWDAVAMLLFAMASGRTWLALPLLVAFSAGLASVLVALGIVVVKSRDAIQKRTGDTDSFERWTGRIAILSALIIVGMGIWLCAKAGVGS